MLWTNADSSCSCRAKSPARFVKSGGVWRITGKKEAFGVQSWAWGVKKAGTGERSAGSCEAVSASQRNDPFKAQPAFPAWPLPHVRTQTETETCHKWLRTAAWQLFPQEAYNSSNYKLRGKAMFLSQCISAESKKEISKKPKATKFWRESQQRWTHKQSEYDFICLVSYLLRKVKALLFFFHCLLYI